jgi:hypothetical protein
MERQSAGEYGMDNIWFGFAYGDDLSHFRMCIDGIKPQAAAVR